ncbi:MAG: hypothetical protein Q4A58_02840 [Fusobacterium sp.]|nr:hypothetical protein [Fusobacterium sp.]MDO4690214.1 hypothetical protein [Fusobacterium sp.]
MNYDIGKNALLNIKKEIIKMSEILDSNKYKPIYGRFLLDFPQTKLVAYLLEVAYFYNENV